MEQRLSLITLGVSDLERAIAFYRGLGWELHPGSVPGEVVFFQLDGMAFAIWSRAKLAADSAVTDGGGWGGVTLAHNVRSPEEVDARKALFRKFDRDNSGALDREEFLLLCSVFYESLLTRIATQSTVSLLLARASALQGVSAKAAASLALRLLSALALHSSLTEPLVRSAALPRTMAASSSFTSFCMSARPLKATNAFVNGAVARLL